MRRLSHNTARTLIALFAIAALAACTGEIEGPRGATAGSGTVPGENGFDPTKGGLKPGITGIDPETVDCLDTLDVAESSMRRLTRLEYNNTIRDLLGTGASPADAFGEDEKVGGFDSNAVVSVSQLGVEQYATAAEELATDAVAGDLNALLGCDPAADGEADCIEEFILRFGMRAYRRPLEAAELDTMTTAFNAIRAEGTFEDGVRIVLQIFLQSPSFLYHTEVGTPVEGHDGVVRLTPWETASRLSYFFWGSMPDEELFVAALSGGLETKADIAAQASRLMQDDRARATLVDFHHQWLELDHFDAVTKDAELYPEFDDALRDDMIHETELFVERVIFEENGTIDDLFQARHSYINANLAALYGVEPPADDGFHRTELDPAQRSGLLTQPSLLAMHAKGNQSSPIHRGMFVRERLLCQVIPDPPPGLEVNPPEFDPNLTTRERFDQHRADPSCAGCHNLMDPIGYGFENYDAVGGFRSEDQGFPVDASGQFMLTEDIDGAFDGVVEMAEMLAGSEEVRACMAEQWFRYALKRTTGVQDYCSFNEAYDAFEESDFTIKELMVAVASTDAFIHRRVPAETTP